MGDVFPKFRAAAVQAAPVFLDREKTLEKTEALIQEAARDGADLIVFPESFIPGYPYFVWLGAPMWYHKFFKQWFKNSVEIPSKTTEALGGMARRANAHVAIGVTEREGNTCYNTLLFFDRGGKLVGRHRKLMPTHVERTMWGMGDGSDLIVVPTDIGRLGGLICWEHTMNLARHALAVLGEQIHCAVWVGFSNVTGWEQLFNMSTELCARYHAHVGECFVINVQNTTTQETVDVLAETDYQRQWFHAGGGWTAIIAPGGAIIAGPLTDKEGILSAEIDLDAIVDMAHYHDAVGHYARHDVVRLLLNREKYVAAESPAHVVTPTPSAQMAAVRQSFDVLKRKIAGTHDKELIDLAGALEVELYQGA